MISLIVCSQIASLERLGYVHRIANWSLQRALYTCSLSFDMAHEVMQSLGVGTKLESFLVSSNGTSYPL